MRNIDLNKPLSADDRAFLAEWSRWEDIKQNEAKFGKLSALQKQNVSDQVDQDAVVDAERNKAPEELPFDSDLVDMVDSMDTGDIRARLEKINRLNDQVNLKTDGDRSELEEILLNYLQDEREAAAQ